MSLSVEVKGTAQVRARLAALVASVPAVVAAALYQEAELVMTASKDQVPVDTGTLKNSGFVNDPDVNGGEIAVVLGYGGAASAYALKQHEDLTLRHDDGNAKFLERPVLAAGKGLAARLAARVKSALRT